MPSRIKLGSTMYDTKHKRRGMVVSICAKVVRYRDEQGVMRWCGHREAMPVSYLNLVHMRK